MPKKITTILKVIAIFVAGAIGGGSIMTYDAASTFDGLRKASALFQVAEQTEEGDYLYKNASPQIAIYKLKRILTSIDTYDKANIHFIPETDENWDKGLLCGRIGKLYKKEGNQKEAKEYLTKSLAYFEQFGWKLTDDNTLLTAIDMLDNQKWSQVLHNIGQYVSKKK